MKSLFIVGKKIPSGYRFDSVELFESFESASASAVTYIEDVGHEYECKDNFCDFIFWDNNFCCIVKIQGEGEYILINNKFEAYAYYTKSHAIEFAEKGDVLFYGGQYAKV